jgi:two-component system chemotaxis response regulator CheY
MAFRILIVDDSPAMRSVIRRVIQLSGFELEACLEAGDGAEAFGLLRQNWVDVVLTDVNMPVMSGEELMSRLQEDELLRSIPVVVVSTDASEHRMRRLLGLGARGYVTKPFHPERLRAQLERVLGVGNG